jgi:beta-barrel assembly-enhancing protease
MKLSFNGKYYDGQRPLANECQVSITSDALLIHCAGQQGVAGLQQWEVQQIHPADLDGLGKVVLKYGPKPHQYLEVNDTEFVDALRLNYKGAAFLKSGYKKVMVGGFALSIIILAGLLGIVSLIYFYVLPAAAEKVGNRLPISWEIKMGESAFKEMKKEFQIDGKGSAALQNFFKELRYKSDYPVEVTLVKDSTVNAFALPGGHIVVFTGIMDKMQSYDELVALLSHEFTHVQKKHATRSICRKLSGYLFLSLLTGDDQGVAALLLENSNQLLDLSYSRSLEEEADKNGLMLMKERNIDPNGMIHLFTRFKKEEKGDAEVEFIRTHPLTDARIEYVKKEISGSAFNVLEDARLDSLFQQLKGK